MLRTGAVDLKEKITSFPDAPGVYLMKDERGQVIYAGKALHLKKRVQQYFAREAGTRAQIKFLLAHVVDIDCVVTRTEKEAFLLEETLIKKHRPRYNIQLKDDKTYVSLMLETTHPFPALHVTRRVKKDGNLYFGPYASAFACRQTADFLQNRFRLRTCSNREMANRSRPCLQYQIKRCDAPCVGWIPETEYREIVHQVRLFLEGKGDELVASLEKEMRAASEALQYEEAARLRDLIHDIKKTLETQRVVAHGEGDADFFALYREGEGVEIALLTVRAGRVTGTREYFLKSPDEQGEILESFLLQYYAEETSIPPDVYLSHNLPSPVPLAEILSGRRSGRVRLMVPRRVEKADLLAIAQRNAREAFRQRAGEAIDVEEVFTTLQARLNLGRLPRRIECFDISNIHGLDAVGSMVSFLDGAPDKGRYRKFIVRHKKTPDDTAMMYEILSRRFRLGESSGGKGDDWKREMPDLLVVDGGKGQLAVATSVLKENHVLGVDAIGIAKPGETEREDKIYVPGRKDAILLGPHSSALFLLQRIRDEAHRFAVTFHRKRRIRKTLAKK